MKSSTMTKRGQVYSVGNYLMTGKVLGKGHFAKVEEATHRLVGKKVAIKIIDLTSIKEDYARRNLHREPRVMARLRHPCIAALYETMMHGPRLYVVMEAAGGGDLCAHVLAGRGGTSGLPEARARSLAAQLVSAVRHMHSRGVVHRDLKMENIMLDVTKQFIKIVDFGLSNMWSAGGALRTPCGSLEYAAPELFVDGRRYGPEVDLWSIGVIVYGMVTGGLPFSCADGGEGKSRAQLRAAISKGFTRKQRAALACVSLECKNFIQHLLEPHAELRLTIEEASKHKWVRRPGLRMKTHPFIQPDTKLNREIYRQISELVGQNAIDVAAQIKADPFGAFGGIYNIKLHLQQMQAIPGTDLLWSSLAQEPRPCSPPEYKARYELELATATCSKMPTPSPNPPIKIIQTTPKHIYTPEKTKILTHSLSQKTIYSQNGGHSSTHTRVQPQEHHSIHNITNRKNSPGRIVKTLNINHQKIQHTKTPTKTEIKQKSPTISPRFLMNRPTSSLYSVKKPTYKIHDNGDCGLDPRLPSIDEHSNLDLSEITKNKGRTSKLLGRTPLIRKIYSEHDHDSRSNSGSDAKKTEFYRRAGDGYSCWRTNGVVPTPPARILLQSNATTIKRASLGNIVSPHSSTNSQCKSERALPIPWFSSRSSLAKDPQHIQRFRRTAPLK